MPKPPRFTRSLYLIERSVGIRAKVSLPWRIVYMRTPSDTVGTVIGGFTSRKQALEAAKLLAGRHSDVRFWDS